MSRLNQISHRPGLYGAALFALLCMLAAPAFAAPTDAWITTKVKLALFTTEGVSSTVNVDTVNRQVTLHGKVGSEAEKNKTESVAKGIDGVTGVRNFLQIVPSEQQAAVQESDDDIRSNVDKALGADKSLKHSAITVQSVNKGLVLLGGTAKTMTDQLNAVEIASGVKGVRRVTSEIQSPDTLADAQIWRDDKPTADAEYTTGAAASDLWINSMVKMRLLAESKTPGLDINVDTRNGVVTLFGMVSEEGAKTAAGVEALKVRGVKDVRNELQVVSSAKQPDVKAKDDDIKRGIEKGLEDHGDLSDVGVEVENCVARLTGTVPTGIERLETMQIARATQGVCSVQNDLHLAD